jgi:hypothetical protein
LICLRKIIDEREENPQKQGSERDIAVSRISIKWIVKQ